MGLQGANKSAHWDGWEIENPLELYCTSQGDQVPRNFWVAQKKYIRPGIIFQNQEFFKKKQQIFLLL